MTGSVLHILSGGAANGLVSALEAQFTHATGARIAGTFGAVGAMKAKLLDGAAADLLILTPPLIDALIASGHAVAGSARGIGIVRTAVAVPTGRPLPPIADSAALAAALSAADSIHIPDPKLATAGIHVAKVIADLGLTAATAARLHVYANGQTAMAAMARLGGNALGLTQVTEILNTPGVTLVGPLPKAHELATVYTLAVSARAERPDLALQLASILTADAAATDRRRCGFEEQ